MAKRENFNSELEWAIATYKERHKWENWYQLCKAAVKNGKPECMKEFRSFCNQKAKEGLQEFREYYKRSYIFGAVDSFDEYMIAVEWYRPLEKKFWLPRRNILLPVANAMQRLVEGELDLLAVSLPPGTGKTTLKNFLLTWVAGKYPDKPNLDSGHSASMTRSTYDGCLQIMKDPEYLWSTIFPGNKVITDANELRIDVDKKHRFSTITCRSIDGSLTGATRAEMLLTADDLVSGIEEAMSKERLDKKWFSYTNDLKSRKKEKSSLMKQPDVSFTPKRRHSDLSIPSFPFQNGSLNGTNRFLKRMAERTRRSSITFGVWLLTKNQMKAHCIL